jgi:hypothetical protein
MKKVHINQKYWRYVFFACFISLSLNANASYFGSHSGKYGDGFGYSVNVWKESTGTNQFTYKFSGTSWKGDEGSKTSTFDNFNHNSYSSFGSNWSSYDIACFVNGDRKHHGTSYDHNYGVVPLPAAAPLFASALAVFGFIAYRRKKI